MLFDRPACLAHRQRLDESSQFVLLLKTGRPSERDLDRHSQEETRSSDPFQTFFSFLVGCLPYFGFKLKAISSNTTLYEINVAPLLLPFPSLYFMLLKLGSNRQQRLECPVHWVLLLAHAASRSGGIVH